MTTNTERAARILPVLAAHAAVQGQEQPNNADACQDLLSDLMHFCEVEGLDFEDLLNLADMAFRQESEGPSPLPLPDPLIQRQTP